MELPFIKKIPSYKSNIYSFKGIDARDGAKAGSASQALNISSSALPYIVPRKSRGQVNVLKADIKTCIEVNGKNAYVSGKEFWYGNEKKGEISSDSPSMAVMGDYIVIAPDMAYYKISDDSFGTLSFSKDYSVQVYFGRTYSSEIDGWGFGGGLYDYIGITGERYFENIFRPSDTVILSFKEPLVSGTLTTVIGEIEVRVEWARGDRIYFPVNTFNLEETAYGGDNSELSGGVQVTETYVSGLEVTKKTIKPEYICEKNNRLWGCDEKTIYASKLGDPLVYTDYQGLSTDSWALETASDGKFTGCISTQSYILFFKENCIYKIYGNMPSNFQSSVIKADGVRKDSSKSLCSYNGLVFYLSNRGVMAFSGDEPYMISAPLGEINLTDGKGITDGKRYYLSSYENGNERFFIFDIENKLWMEESPENTACFILNSGEIRNVSKDGKCFSLYGGNSYSDWSVTFGKFNENMYEKKHYGKIFIHFELGNNAEIKAELSTDGKEFSKYFSTQIKGRRSVAVPIDPNRSETVLIRLSGHGYCKIYSIGREMRKGSVN